MKVKVKLLENWPLENDQLPSYATQEAVGLDLPAGITEPVTLPAGERKLIPVGMKMEITDRSVGGFVFPRSGLALKHGINLANGVGVIDPDYRGELMCPLQNNSSVDFIIRPGDRIAQLVFLPVVLAQLIKVDELEDSARGEGGFGSTGIGK